MIDEKIELKEIKEFKGYAAGSDGNIWSYYNWRGKGFKPIKGYPSNTGYLRVILRENKKTTRKSVHRLICESFYGPAPKGKLLVRHLNGDKLDNRPYNLSWGSHKDNESDKRKHGRVAWGQKNGFASFTNEQRILIQLMAKYKVPTGIIVSFVGGSSSSVKRLRDDKRVKQIIDSALKSLPKEE